MLSILDDLDKLESLYEKCNMGDFLSGIDGFDKAYRDENLVSMKELFVKKFDEISKKDEFQGKYDFIKRINAIDLGEISKEDLTYDCIKIIKNYFTDTIRHAGDQIDGQLKYVEDYFKADKNLKKGLEDINKEKYVEQPRIVLGKGEGKDEFLAEDVAKTANYVRNLFDNLDGLNSPTIKEQKKKILSKLNELIQEKSLS
jgi:hypothetical protein